MDLSVAAAVELGKRGRTEDQDQDQGHGDAKRLALVPWPPHQQHPSSRIYRVSRGSGGKDRHSKVYTAKGIRDRRVRLSVATAIQFYDLQDRLGYDQPSKAVEWLIKAAAAAIDKLPELEAAAFPNHPASANKQSSALQPEAHGSQPQQQQLTRSACSSTSETSKGSVLSLSRSDSRVKARERARDRSASVKDKEAGDDSATRAPSAQAASFTELLTGLAAATPAAAQHKHHNSWHQMTASATADYLGFAQPRKSGHGMLHTFASPAPHLGNIAPVAMAPGQHFSLSAGGEPQTEMPHFSFSQDHYMPVHAAATSAPSVDYNLNFSMSSGLVGVNNTRGTLQSNSQPHLSGHHQQQQLQRLSTPLDAPHIPFLFSPAVAVASPTTAESHFGAAAALQLWEGFRHSDMKEKGKN
ncbi:transcription factor PCF6-like [Hordeum vulgare subsp. vulgare]|uniref:Predicted protein n=1 Tax=Hordeum vulgare subsp. vulgare TaxID=112509 RepID=F2E2H7_HORVV|nr:transcription factor PCF6-like [Hordeum vulgare subsp. vulgare]KAI5012482.1 hypothetical protein ZWY2020_024748 [Hordeum vulgare]BAK01549.1 predicted protein [Hordeum vulgare subsp. vulgare]